MYQIEKKPIEPRRTSFWHNRVPVDQMDIGDSVLVPNPHIDEVGGIEKARQQLISLFGYRGKRIRSKREDGGLRIWRVR